MFKPTSVCSAAALSLAAAFVAEDSLRFDPAGSVTRSFGETTRWELTSLVELVGGTELPAEEIDFFGSSTRELELVDTFGPIADGRPEHLTRTFEQTDKFVEIEFAMQGLEELYEVELDTDLVDETVRFEWDGDEGVYVASSEAGLDSLQLERLTEDCDLRALLPEAAEEGDSWTVPAAELAQLFTPAGELFFTTDEVPDGPYNAMTPVDVAAISFLSLADAAQELEGEATVTWDGTQTDGELMQAVLEIELDAQLSGGLGEELQRLVDDMEASGKQGVRLDFEWSVEGRGQLVWNLSVNHFESFELELEGALELEMVWNQDGGEAGALVGFSTRTSLSAEAAPAQ